MSEGEYRLSTLCKRMSFIDQCSHCIEGSKHTKIYSYEKKVYRSGYLREVIVKCFSWGVRGGCGDDFSEAFSSWEEAAHFLETQLVLAQQII